MAIPDQQSYLATAIIITDEHDNVYWTEEQPFLFEPFIDNIIHVAGAGDTWWGLAGKAYATLSDRPAKWWRIIAQFQPTPVVNPLLPIVENTIIHIPSPRVLIEEILDPSRRSIDPEV